MTVKKIKELLFASLSWPHRWCHFVTLTLEPTSFITLLQQQMWQIPIPTAGWDCLMRQTFELLPPSFRINYMLLMSTSLTGRNSRHVSLQWINVGVGYSADDLCAAVFLSCCVIGTSSPFCLSLGRWRDRPAHAGRGSNSSRLVLPD